MRAYVILLGNLKRAVRAVYLSLVPCEEHSFSRHFFQDSDLSADNSTAVSHMLVIKVS